MRLSFPSIALAALLLPAALVAQTQSFLPRTTTLPASTGAMALGDSYVMNSGHSDVLFYHPARLVDASGFGAVLQRWGVAGSAAAFSGSFDAFGGTWGIGVRSLQYGVPDGGSFQAPVGQDHHFVPGGDPVSERTATIGYGREVFGGISAGLAIGLVDARVESSQNNIMLVDVGLSTDLGPLGLGLTAHDIGDKPFGDFGAGPSRIVLGDGAYRQQVGILDLGLAANAGIDAEDELTYGAGLEIGYYP